MDDLTDLTSDEIAALPPNLRAEYEQAAQLAQKAAPGKAPTPDTSPTAAETPPTAAPEPESAPDPEPTPEPPATDAPDPPPTADSEPAATETAPDEPTDNALLAMKGRLKKREREFAAAQADWEKEREQLQAQMQALTQAMQGKQQQPEGGAAATGGQSGQSDMAEYLDSLREDLGDATVDAMQRMHTAAVSAAVDRAQALVEERVKPTEERVSRSAADQFRASLDAAAPRWRQHYETDAFEGYLETVDPRSGRTYRDLLDEAVTDSDVRRTAYFFKDFEDGQKPAGSGKRAVQSQVSPGQTAAPSAPAPQKPIDAQQVYAAIEQALRMGDHAKAQQLEAELDRAVAEGRVA